MARYAFEFSFEPLRNTIWHLGSGQGVKVLSPGHKNFNGQPDRLTIFADCKDQKIAFQGLKHGVEQSIILAAIRWYASYSGIGEIILCKPGH
ncbi:MAG: hypothetical protein INR69_07600 [Mucilaginibacter polytrichastri]|nr:hypothetical protein [Mucilaginibacter polytrichastri]